MKLRQCAVSTAFFVAAALLLFFNDFYFRRASDLKQIGEFRATENLINYIVGAAMGGGLFSFVEFFLLENLFSRFGLVALTAGRAIMLMAIYAGITTFLSFYYNATGTGLSPLHPAVLDLVLDYLTGPVNTINFVFYFVFAILLVYFHQIASIVGRGVLGKFLFARYKKPGIVERVFLFLDINTSTSIAEQIGPEKFFSMIQDFLVEAGKEILERGGEIYKYVGDEIIAVWPLDTGGQRAEALRCLFGIRRRIQLRADYFRENYGVIPEFKSGLHSGPAMMGELGDWKREIAYMGDTLNTTARIQGACKKLGAMILLSEDYYQLVEEKSTWSFQKAGRGRLRGKDRAITLYHVEQQKPLEQNRQTVASGYPAAPEVPSRAIPPGKLKVKS